MSYHPDDMPMLPVPLPPTPSPSIHSPKRQSSFFGPSDMEQPVAGPSQVWRPAPRTQLPPTPPVHDDEQMAASGHFSSVDSRRVQHTRRSVNAYPRDETYHQTYTDPAREQPLQPQHQLDVDLDAYSATEFDTDEGLEEREPTLSFVTTSTIDSTTSTPSMGMTYGYQPEVDAKIRVRQGRSHAYSSAESSMASGAYSGYGYPDQIYNPQPPPLPVMPSAYAPPVGLGITAEFPPGSGAQVESPTSNPSLSPSHRPWRRDIANRLRSDSAASSLSTASLSTSESGPSSSRIPPPDNTFYSYDSYRMPWEETRAEAVAMVDEGRENILTTERLEAMPGYPSLTEETIRSQAGVTHLILPGCGSHILSFLPNLLVVLAPSLVALDISNNDLSFLPETLGHCTSLEELNVSGNPLRQIPTFVSELVAIRVLAADDCRLQSLPTELSQLGGLHTLCARRNKLVSLPPWLCLLNHLEALKIDGNPFAPEWAAIVAPILASASKPISRPGSHHHRHLSINNGIRSPPSMASLASSITASSLRDGPSIGTPPHSAAHSVLQLGPIAEDHPHSAPPEQTEIQRKGLRKMRSAGALLSKVNLGPTQTHSENPGITPVLSAFGVNPVAPAPPASNKFATLTSSDGRRAASAMGNYDQNPAPGLAPTKTGKWGFLRKMSMHRLKDKDKPSGTAAMVASASANLKTMPPLQHLHSEPIPTLPRPGMLSSHSAMTLPSRITVPSSDTNEFGQVTEPPSSSTSIQGSATTPVRGKRRSFLPLDLGPPSINISISPTSPFSSPLSGSERLDRLPTATSEATIATMTTASPADDGQYAQGLESIKSYLRDLYDLSRAPIEPYGGFEVVPSADGSCAASSVDLGSPMSGMQHAGARRSRRPTLDTQNSRAASVVESEQEETEYSGKKFKNDKSKRARIIREIYETERTYVRGLGELVSIYVRPACQPVNPNKSNETVVPAAERKIVFGGVESILSIHRDNFLPALEKAVRPLLEGQDDDEGSLSAATAHAVGEVFRTYIAYMKQYSTYINNFDNALSRMKTWSAPSSSPNTPPFTSKPSTPNSGGISAAAVNVGISAISSLSSGPDSVPISGGQLSSSQKKRVKTFLKRCKEHPRHSQISLESYLLLPIQRVPRYKLLLEDLAMCTPPRSDGIRDTLDDALNEIASLASLMNEEKREADSRLRLLSWQQRITKSGPSPLVQPHRRLILEGPLSLIRLVKKGSTFVETDSLPVDGETITPSKIVVPVEYIKPELVDRQVMLVLCSDLMVLATQTQRGDSWEGMVDLFNVLRMATLREPASIVRDNVLRVVDNKSIYYFNGASHEETLQWCRAINSARRR